MVDSWVKAAALDVWLEGRRANLGLVLRVARPDDDTVLTGWVTAIVIRSRIDVAEGAVPDGTSGMSPVGPGEVGLYVRFEVVANLPEVGTRAQDSDSPSLERAAFD